MIDILSMICTAIGVFFMFVAALGILRLSDFYIRVHAPTKAATLGLLFLGLAYILMMSRDGIPFKVLLIFVFISGTIPIGSHILTRAAYRSRVKVQRPLMLDEYLDSEASKHRDSAPTE